MKKSKSNKTKALHFNVDGEHLTYLIRQTYIEGRAKIALALLNDSNCPKEYWYRILEGSMKMVGINDLHLEKDNTDECCSMPLKIEKLLPILEKQYLEILIRHTNAYARYMYWPLRIDAKGVFYCNAKITDTLGFQCGSTSLRDEEILKHDGRELIDRIPFFLEVLPLYGIKYNMYDLIRRINDELDVFDVDHPYYLPNMMKKMEIPDIKRIKENYNSQAKKYERANPFGQYDQHEIDFIKQIEEDINRNIHEAIVPYGLDVPHVVNAWILRDGSFYGDDKFSWGMLWIHREIAERLYECDKLPQDENIKDDPERYLEKIGAIKISAGIVYYYPDHSQRNGMIEITKEQIQTLKEYARVRNLYNITVGFSQQELRVDLIESLTASKFLIL